MDSATQLTAIPREEYLSPGHLACQGCGAALAMRLLLKGIPPVAHYVTIQGRFHHLSGDEITTIQRSVDAAWMALLARADSSGNRHGQGADSPAGADPAVPLAFQIPETQRSRARA